MAFSGGNGAGRRGRKRPMSEINVTPMVDVMLVLLVIFMVTAPMMTSGVQVDLPKAEAQPLPGQDKPLEITIDKKGGIHLEDTEIELSALVPKLKAISGEKADTRIFIRGDNGINYGRVMEVMSEVNAGGFNKVALITEPGAARKKR